MEYYKRIIDLSTLCKERSLFLFGPRMTGKSYWITKTMSDLPYLDLLDENLFTRLLTHPGNLESLISPESKLVVIDEIQRIPKLLPVIHKLIENRSVRFLLTGSCARKLRRGSEGLLGGRARKAELFPLTSVEIHNFDLLKYCHIGGLPLIYNSSEPWLDLQSYVSLYLREEIQAEAYVRNLASFARFLEIFGVRSGEELNVQKFSSDAGVPERTASNYIEILKDTLVVTELKPISSSIRKSTSRSKYYFFDVGVANYLGGRKSFTFNSADFGTALEHFIIQEVKAWLGYSGRSEVMSYWRTYQGDVVDLIIGNQMAIEIKATEKINERDFRGLLRLRDENIIKKYMVVSRDPLKQWCFDIPAVPITEFLELLWSNKLLVD